MAYERKRLSLLASIGLAAAMAAGTATAQNADKNTSGPTANDYQLKVVEPAEGAVVTGSSMQVVVNLALPPEVGGQDRNDDSMPRPRADVFLDNDLQGTLEHGRNVLTLNNVAAGEHKLVVMAKNLSGEIIDRKEVSFRSEPAVTSAAPASAHSSSMPSSMNEDRPSAGSTETMATNTDRSGSMQTADSSRTTTMTSETTTTGTMNRNDDRTSSTADYGSRSTLPETASRVPAAGAAGLILLVAGALLRIPRR